MKAEAIAARIGAQLAANHLVVRGWFRIEAGDLANEAEPGLSGAPALLIGNHGPAMWHAFARSAEARDIAGDPLDRWTARMIGRAARSLQGRALFPFGKPVWPFQRWAGRAMGLKASPLGILIHPRFGLWHALRGAIAFPGIEIELPAVEKPIHACDDCREKPCLTACPVSAFSPRGFDAAACRGYLAGCASSQTDSRPDPDCMQAGCAARAACPLGREHGYDGDQIRFHMTAFRG
jgi:hypothetical protein